MYVFLQMLACCIAAAAAAAVHPDGQWQQSRILCFYSKFVLI